MTHPTRESILDAARDLFYEKGMSASSMRDIAGRVGMAQSSLYNHFATKEALSLAVMERSFELVDAAVRPVFESGPPSVDLFRAALRLHALQHVHGIRETTVFELEREHMPPLIRDRVVELRGVYERRYYKLAEALVQEGCFTEKETQTRVRMLLSAGRDISRWFRTGGRLTEEEVADIYADLSLSALRGR
ncbi:MAG: TetR family transcriptional regulator [Dehalococcoidia bacterium]|nr:TetR family transcriptional regulator [Dehalococcoidia bacterium]